MLFPIFEGKQLTRKPINIANCAKNTVVPKHSSNCSVQEMDWIAAGKSHEEWRDGKTASINVQQDVGVNQLMAQQVKFQKTMM